MIQQYGTKTAAQWANKVAEHLKARFETVSVAESCTGGLLAAAFTDLEGSSQWFESGVVSYSNAAKTNLLGVPESVFRQHGAVSGPCVEAMAVGCRARFGTHYALSISGIAGPGGGSPDKPVGLVWFALASSHGCETWSSCFSGGRAEVRQAAVIAAMNRLVNVLEDKSC